MVSIVSGVWDNGVFIPDIVGQSQTIFVPSEDLEFLSTWNHPNSPVMRLNYQVELLMDAGDEHPTIDIWLDVLDIASEAIREQVRNSR